MELSLRNLNHRYTPGNGASLLPGPEFAPPATMELSLRNLNHRYTPGNGASLLAGRVQPGREVWLRAAWLYDDFASDGGTAETLDDRRTTIGADNWWVMVHFLNKNVTFSPNPLNGVIRQWHGEARASGAIVWSASE